MISVKQTDLYPEAIKELNYPFGDIFVFKGFVISEIAQGQNINWDDHAKSMAEDICAFLGTNGSDIVYISNRINSYSVVALDWLKFFKHRYNLKAYCIVSKNEIGTLSGMIEKLFYTKNIRYFSDLLEAVNYAKESIVKIA